MIRVLFVCLGNICRSPMAEGIFKKMLEEKSAQHEFIVESRATSAWEIGKPPHPGTRKILERIGFDWTGMKAKQISKQDYEKFDYIIGMDEVNVSYLIKHAGIHKDKIHLMRDINPKTKNQNIPDPFFNNTHEHTYLLINESLLDWYEKLISVE